MRNDHNSNILYCTNDDCEAKIFKKIAGGLGILGIKGIKEARVKELFEKSDGKIKSIIKYFDHSVMNYHYLTSIGVNANQVLDKLKNIKEIPLKKVIQAMRIPHVGNTVSQQVANVMSKVKPNFSNVNREALSKFVNESTESIKTNSQHVIKLGRLIKYIKGFGIIVVLESNKSTNSKRFEMSGDPPNWDDLTSKYVVNKKIVTSDLKSKGDYIKLLKLFKLEHSSIAKSNLLIVEDYQLDTGKVKYTKKHPQKDIKVISYEDVLLKLKLIKLKPSNITSIFKN